MRPLILTDLDDTLFQTLRKCPDGQSDSLKMMSRLADGSPSGFATVPQQNFLSWLRFGHVVPITARSSEVLARVDIEQAPAIVSNGGCILVGDGEYDRDWHDQLETEAQKGADIGEVYRAITVMLNEEHFRHWIVSENGLPLYIVIKSNKDADADLELVLSAASGRLPSGWRHHLNGNNLAFLPPWLNKRQAAAYLIGRKRNDAAGTPIIGIGDSTSDVGFMDLCDFAVTPTGSQLWRSITQDNEWVR